VVLGRGNVVVRRAVWFREVSFDVFHGVGPVGGDGSSCLWTPSSGVWELITWVWRFFGGRGGGWVGICGVG
jgi:hypothetical protein